MINSVYNRICSIEYRINNIESYVVLVPGISLLVFKTKLAFLEKEMEANLAHEASLKNDSMLRTSRFSNNTLEAILVLDAWHVIGNLVQLISLVAFAIMVHPVFMIPLGVAVYEARTLRIRSKVIASMQNSRLATNTL